MDFAFCVHFPSRPHHQIVRSRSSSRLTTNPPIGKETPYRPSHFRKLPRLISSLPALKVLGSPYPHEIYLTKADADITQIAAGLGHSGASPTHICLDGLEAVQHTVSHASMKRLCEVIKTQHTRLEEIMLWNLDIDEEDLLGLIGTCTKITTTRQIR